MSSLVPKHISGSSRVHPSTEHGDRSKIRVKPPKKCQFDALRQSMKIAVPVLDIDILESSSTNIFLKLILLHAPYDIRHPGSSLLCFQARSKSL